MIYAIDSLKGRVVLITGAISGIGAATARSMAKLGARLLLSGRDEERLNRVAGDAGAEMAISCDLSLDDEPEELAAQIHQKYGAIDVLVNNAGIGVMRPSGKLTATEINTNLAINVRAPLILSGRFATEMAKKGGGSIVNISSIVGSMGTPFQATYAATKGAIDAMTRSLANEFGPKGVRVNAIAPGAINTEMWHGRLDDPNFAEAVKANIPLRTIADPEAIADTIIFLASDASRYITGEVILVDGGLVRTGHIVNPELLRPRK